jgi:hypothetical protein
VPALIRARHPQMLLALLAERHPNVHAKVVPALVCGEKLTNALPVQWLPVEMDIELIEVVGRQLSPATMDALVSERQRREMGSALYKTFVSTTLKLFGASPTTVIKHLGRGWRQMFSECGVVDVVKHDKQSALVRISALPEACLQSSAWIGALPAGLRVLYELVNAKGDVAVDRRDAHVDIHFTWT